MISTKTNDISPIKPDMLPLHTLQLEDDDSLYHPDSHYSHITPVYPSGH